MTHQNQVLFQASQAEITVHADTPWGTLQIAHAVISLCSDEVLLTKKFPDYTLTFMASWGVTQILQPALENESPGPEEHKMAVGSAIEALVQI